MSEKIKVICKTPVLTWNISSGKILLLARAESTRRVWLIEDESF